MNSLSLIRNSHVSHDLKWMVTGGQCVACLAEIIEDSTVLQVKKKVAVDELLRLMNDHGDEMLCILSYDYQVTLHLALMLLELLFRGGQLGDSLESAIIEAQIRMLSMVQSDELLSVVMETISQQCSSTCNYKQNLALFTLTGKLFSVAPNLPTQVLRFHGSYVEHIISGLSYSDQAVQIEASYICIQLYSAALTASRSSSESLMPGDVVQRLVRDTISVLHGSSDLDLQSNLLGLMRILLQDDRTHPAFLLSPQTEGLPLMLTIKRLLLGHQVSLQVSVSQCLIYLLRGKLGAEFAAGLLQEDMAEFLFEALHCTNDLIIGSLFCVLLLLTDCPVFFSGCHSVYGVESVLRSIDYVLKIQQTDTVEQGFQLLANILERHRSGVRLFGSASVKLNCLDVIGRGLQLDHSGVFLAAWNAFKHLLRYDHLHPVLPLKNIVGIVEQTVNKFMSRSISWRHPRKHLLTGIEPETSRRLQKHLPSSVLYSMELNAVILQLARVVSCGKEMALDDSMFHGPNSSVEPYTFNDFCQWLLQTILRICLPLTLRHCESVTAGLRVDVVFLDLLSALHLLYVSIPQDSHSLDAELIRSGFLGLLMNIKTQSQGCPELNNITVQLLVLLLDCGVFGLEDNVDDTERNTSHITVKEGLGLCNGRLEDVITQLQTDVAYGGNSYRVIWNKVIAVLYLLYTAYCHGDRCTKPTAILTLVGTLLQVHHQHGTTLTRTMLRCSIYLLAEAVCESENLAGTIDLHPIVCGMQQHEDVGLWCMKSPLVLRWSFSEEPIYSIFSKQVLLFFICNGFEKDVTELAARNIPCTKALVNLIAFCEDRSIVYTTLNILKALLTKPKDQEEAEGVGSSETRSFLQSYLPDVTQKTFLLPDRDMPAENMSVLVEVLAASRGVSDESISTQELKIVDYVQSLLKHSSAVGVDRQQLDGGVEKLYNQAINYLNLLLVKSIEQTDSRVAMLLASSVSLCRYLSQVVSDAGQCSTHPKALFCVALMQIALSSAPPLSVLNTVTLNIDMAQFLCCANLKPIDMAIRFLLISTIFSGVSSRTTFVRLVNTRKDLKQLALGEADEPITGLPFTSTHLRSLYITLQNSLLKEDEALSAAALCCLSNMFKVIEKTHELYNHLLSQPWNHFLLDIVLSRLASFGAGATCPSLAALGVLNLMVTWNPSLFVSHRTETVVDIFLRFSVADDSACSVMFVKVIKEMIAKGIVSADSIQRQKIEDRLQEVESAITARNEDFESTGQVISFSFAEMMDIQTMKKFIKFLMKNILE